VSITWQKIVDFIATASEAQAHWTPLQRNEVGTSELFTVTFRTTTRNYDSIQADQLIK